MKAKKQNSESSNINSEVCKNTMCPPSSQRYTGITNTVAKDMCPINMVSNTGFRRMLNLLGKTAMLSPHTVIFLK